MKSIAFGMLALFGAACAQAELEAESKRYRKEREQYMEGLHQAAVVTLNIAFAALPPNRSQRISRSDIKIEIRAGGDAVCFNEGRFRVAASQIATSTIVLCESDFTLLTDAALFTGLNAALESGVISGLKPDQKGPLEKEVSRAIKARALRGLDYFVSINRAKKLELKSGNNYIAPCLSWQVAAVSRSSNGEIRCDRRDVSQAIDTAAAEVAMKATYEGFALAIRVADSSTKLKLPDPPVGEQALSAMRQARWRALTMVMQYAVSHELGHLTADDPMSRSVIAELEADRGAVASLGESLEGASLLVHTAAALGWIWQRYGDPDEPRRPESLYKLLFCNGTSPLRARANSSPLLTDMVRMYASECR